MADYRWVGDFSFKPVLSCGHCLLHKNRLELAPDCFNLLPGQKPALSLQWAAGKLKELVIATKVGYDKYWAEEERRGN